MNKREHGDGGQEVIPPTQQGIRLVFEIDMRPVVPSWKRPPNATWVPIDELFVRVEERERRKAKISDDERDGYAELMSSSHAPARHAGLDGTGQASGGFRVYGKDAPPYSTARPTKPLSK